MDFWAPLKGILGRFPGRASTPLGQLTVILARLDDALQPKIEALKGLMEQLQEPHVFCFGVIPRSNGTIIYHYALRNSYQQASRADEEVGKSSNYEVPNGHARDCCRL